MKQPEDLWMAQLLCAAENRPLPEGTDAPGLVAEGLIEPDQDGWKLTMKGQLRLRNLQSIARFREA